MALSYSAGAISAKARAMYGRCLTRQDYKNLLSCHNVGEVASYLKTRTHYADVLADVNEGAVHRGYLEAVIRRKLFDDYESLMHYDRSMNQRLSDYYIKKSEIEQIMHCLHLMRAHRTQVRQRRKRQQQHHKPAQNSHNQSHSRSGAHDRLEKHGLCQNI